MKQSHLLSLFMPLYLLLQSTGKPMTSRRRARNALEMTGRMVPPSESAVHTYTRQKPPCCKGRRHS
jgi:hypothetical protein